MNTRTNTSTRLRWPTVLAVLAGSALLCVSLVAAATGTPTPSMKPEMAAQMNAAIAKSLGVKNIDYASTQPTTNNTGADELALKKAEEAALTAAEQAMGEQPANVTEPATPTDYELALGTGEPYLNLLPGANGEEAPTATWTTNNNTVASLPTNAPTFEFSLPLQPATPVTTGVTNQTQQTSTASQSQQGTSAAPKKPVAGQTPAQPGR